MGRVELFETLEARRLLSSAHLLKDLAPAGLDPQEITPVGSGIFFEARATPQHELWLSDGAAAGTRKVKAFPNETLGTPDLNNFVDVNGTLYFFATYSDYGHTNELWKSDGTAAGTVHVKTLPAGTSYQSSFVYEPTGVGKNLFFLLAGTTAGSGLWFSNGTPKGTYQVAAASDDGSEPFGLVAYKGRCFFFKTGNPTTSLYASDGTVAGTALVRDTGSVIDVRHDHDVAAIMGETLYFPGGDFDHGDEVWKSDGTTAGTKMAVDVLPGVDSSDADLFFNANGKLLFVASVSATSTDELHFYRSDGTARGTQALANAGVTFTSDLLRYEQFATLGDDVYFTFDDGVHGHELWRTASGQVQMVADLYPGDISSYPARLTAVGGQLFFSADDGVHGRELWRTDGTANGTRMVRDFGINDERGINDDSSGGTGGIAAFKGRAYFGALGDDGNELFASDGTSAGTVQVFDQLDGLLDSKPFGFFSAAGLIFFRANDLRSNQWLYRTDGTAEGTFRLGQTGYLQSIADGGSALYFLLSDQLWASDGTVAGTRKVLDLPSQSSEVYFVNGRLVLYNGGALYTIKSGKEVLLADINPGGADVLHGFVKLGDQLIFSGTDGVHGREVFVTNGTSAGTGRITDIIPGSGNANPDNFTVVGNLCYFTANDSKHGNELWVTDGTTAGTHMVKDGTPGKPSTQFFYPATTDNLLYYFVYLGGPLPLDLWRSDGTDAGTFKVASLPQAGYSGDPQMPVTMKGALYFYYAHKLWRSNGTKGSLEVVKDFAAIEETGWQRLVVANDRLFLRINGGSNGTWESDGTANGTLPIAMPGDGNVEGTGAELFSANGHVFTANSNARGDEPWVIDPSIPVNGIITGTVFSDYDRDGVLDPGEPPLPGYRVYIDRNNDGVCNKNETQTRATQTGRYTFTGLGAGKYIIRETTVETRLPTGPTSYTVNLGYNQRVVRSFANIGGTVTGVVFHDDNRDGVRNAGETGIVKAHLFLDIDNDGVWDEGEYIVRTSSSGRYTFRDVPARTYRIRVFDVPGWTFTNPAVRKITLPAGGSVSRYLG
jgi:ELWxxDGT repeat protein